MYAGCVLKWTVCVWYMVIEEESEKAQFERIVDS